MNHKKMQVLNRVLVGTAKTPVPSTATSTSVTRFSSLRTITIEEARELARKGALPSESQLPVIAKSSQD